MSGSIKKGEKKMASRKIGFQVHNIRENERSNKKKMACYEAIWAMLVIAFVVWIIWTTVGAIVHSNNLELKKFDELQQSIAETEAEFQRFVRGE